jgi:hypothetical protein
LEDSEFSKEARRSVKSAARKVSQEQAASRRLYEERMRQAKAEGDRSYWKMHLRLVEEVSTVNSIKRMHDSRGAEDDPELAQVLRNLAASCEEMAAYVEGSDSVEEIWDIEAEEADIVELGTGPGEG